MPNSFHPLLRRQLNRYGLIERARNPDLWDFLQSINQSYKLYESNHQLVEHAMRLSEEELYEKNQQLIQESDTQKKLIQTLKNAIVEINPVPTPIDENDISKIIDILNNTIQQRKAFETELDIARNNAEKALESRKLFLANMSHEIRTPINAISGLSHILSESKLDQKQMDFVNAIKSSSEGLMVIVNDILDMSKLESGKVQFEKVNFDLHQVLFHLRTGYSLKAEEKGIQLVLQPNPQLPQWIMGDPTRIKQILANLISNAIKFTQVGEVTIATHVTQQDEKKVELQFHISDTGIGIDQDKQDSIFEFFIQEDSTITRKFGGTGLGLAISRSLAEQMEGTLVCSSVKGQGSTFTLTCNFDIGEEEKALETLTIPDFSNKTILVVEDNSLNQFLVVTILEKTNATLLLASNGFDAVDNAMKNNIDLVLMDLQMPEMDGIQATRIIKNDLQLQVPIVALTANGLQEERKKCQEAGMVDFIQKPFKHQELLKKLQLLIG